MGNVWGGGGEVEYQGCGKLDGKMDITNEKIIFSPQQILYYLRTHSSALRPSERQP